jgi:hypothetical protein
LTDQIEFLAAVGVDGNVNPGDGNSIIVNYECDATSLYSYDTGLHVYSPYDSIYTPKLNTFLYSRWAIGSWVVGTRVWSDATFVTPALQYYYGFGNNVYKVGGSLDRSYGTMEIYNVWQTGWRKLRHKDPVTNIKILGPASFKHPLPEDTIEACINVLYSKAGIITEIIPKLSLPQPTKYKYYMGYNVSNKQLSNDNFFVFYMFPEKKYYPITGFQHVMLKLMSGYIESMGLTLSFGRMNNKWMISYVASGVATATISFIRAFPLIKEWVLVTFFGAHPASECIIALPALPVLIFAAIILISGLFNALFNKRRQTFIEPCKQFLSEYTTTPYIESSSQLSRLQDMSDKKPGYYCDGVYFYTQTSPTYSVTTKEISSTNALIAQDPNITVGYLESIPADNPTTVTNISKLFLLPYTSGIPLEFGVTPIYYSEEITRTITITECAELLTTPTTVDYTLPSGYCFSFDNVAAANLLRDAVLDDIDLLVEGRYTYGEPLPEEDLGMLDGYFTHEIRVETNPTICSVFYDNTDRLGLTIGKKIFFDVEGRVEAMNGYYGTDDNAYFRIFYKAVNGYITNKYTMVSSSSTTVQGSPGILSVNTNNLGYSSNWYVKSTGQSLISDIINEYYSYRCFDPNTLYGESYMVRGYYDSANNYFYLYGDNSNNYTISQAPTSWYQPLIEWVTDVPFYYNRPVTVSIDIEEICLPATAYENALYGFYIIGSSGGGVSPLYNAVNLTVRVYVELILKHTYTVITNDSGKTYVPYGTYIDLTDNVTSIVIASINSANPIGNITYTIGTFASCSGCVTTDPFATGLQACWNFEEASGTVYDSTVNNHDLTLNNNVVYHQAGKIGSYATQFNTSTSYLQGDTGLNLSPTMSISVWVKVVGVTSYNRYIYNKAEFGVNGGVVLYVEPGGKPVFGILYGTNINPTGADVNVNDGTWHHIVATMDINILRVCMYVDGVPDLLNPHPCSTPDYGDNNTRITIGNSNLLNTFALYGLLDGLAVWDRVLTPCEVKTLYNSGSGLACV